MRLVRSAAIVIVVGAMVLAVSRFLPAVHAERNAADGPATDATDIRDGQRIFRFDTFGDEQLWTDVLRMHEVVPTIAPATALAVGLKVDVDALPPPIRRSTSLRRNRPDKSGGHGRTAAAECCRGPAGFSE